jgi:hypothetical protein
MKNSFIIDDDESEQQALLHSAKNTSNECAREKKVCSETCFFLPFYSGALLTEVLIFVPEKTP